MAETCGLSISQDFLSIPVTEIQNALRDQDRAKAEQKREEAYIYPGEAHRNTPIVAITWDETRYNEFY